jgi:hypothetical protein
MKKAGMLVAVAVLLGGVSTSFAQGSPSWDARAFGWMMQGVSRGITQSAMQSQQKQVRKQTQTGFPSARLVNKIISKTSVGVSFAASVEVLTMGGTFTSEERYPKQGTFQGWETKDESANYLVMPRADWNAITQKVSDLKHTPNTFVIGKEFKTKEEQYTQQGPWNEKNVRHYDIDGKQITVVMFPFK